MRSILIYILFSLLSYTLNCHAQTFRGISVSDGLPDLVVNALYKDSTGYLWLGTSSSIERFDGIHFKHYSIPATNEKEKEVNVITGMPNNEVWFGNNAGLWRINGDELERIAPDVINSKVYSLLHDGAGHLYVGGEAGLFIINESKVDQVLIDPNILSVANTVKGLALDNKGNLWIATLHGLYSMSLTDKAIKAYEPLDGELSVSYNNIYMIGSVLYLGTLEKGIIAFDTETGGFEYYMDLGCITSLSGNQHDLLYVGTNGNGIYFISAKDKKIVKRIQHDPNSREGLRSNSVYSLLVDRDGIIWAGLFQIGLDYSLYQHELFSVYQHLPELDLKYFAVRAIEIGENDKLIGTRDGLFYIDEKRGICKDFRSSHLRSQMIMCSYAFNGKYYLGTYGGGMYVLDPLTVTLSDFEPQIPNPFIHGQVFSITSDYWDNLWIGTSEGLFCYKDGKQKFHYTSKNSRLPEGNVYKIYFDSTHRGWVCTENGMCLIESSSDRLITDKFPEGFIHKKLLRAIYEDSQHNLYFLSDKGALFVSDLTLNTFREITDTPLDGKNLQSIIEDDEHWLWIGTSDGLFRYDKGENFVSYNFADGVPTSIFLGCPPKKGIDGTLWFGSSQGLFYTNTKRINDAKEYPYTLQITGVSVDNTSFTSPVKRKKGEYEMALNSYKEEVTIYFSDFTYTDPKYMSYEYKMEGKDIRWIPLSGTSKISYYNMSAGKHVFKLRRAGNPDSEICLLLDNSSSAGVYWIPVLIVIVVILGGGYCFYRWRIKKAILDTPQFLSSSEEAISEEIENDDSLLSDDKYKSCNITVEDCRELTERLKAIMRNDKPYIDPKLKIIDLAETLDVPPYKLSYLFNQYLKRTFYDYVNDYRIAEFKYLVNKGEHKTYTLSAMIEKCGFISRASFFRYFKKTTGMTPNEYINTLEQGKK